MCFFFCSQSEIKVFFPPCRVSRLSFKAWAAHLALCSLGNDSKLQVRFSQHDVINSNVVCRCTPCYLKTCRNRKGSSGSVDLLSVVGEYRFVISACYRCYSADHGPWRSNLWHTPTPQTSSSFLVMSGQTLKTPLNVKSHLQTSDLYCVLYSSRQRQSEHDELHDGNPTTPQ